MGIFFSKCFKLDIKFECTLCGERSLNESSSHNEERSKYCLFHQKPMQDETTR